MFDWTETNQSTRPELLPIVGNVADDITLEIASSSRPVFTLVDKQLKLISPLDRDVNDISSVILQVIPLFPYSFNNN